MMDLVTILGTAVQQGASDIHICSGKPPMMRLNGEIEEIPDDDPIFYTAYDLKEKGPVGNFRSLMRNGHAYRADGSVPHWRCIRDDKGRIIVMIDFNLDLGDSWQLADNPQYPQEYSYLGIRLGINYVVYTMTH